MNLKGAYYLTHIRMVFLADIVYIYQMSHQSQVPLSSRRPHTGMKRYLLVFYCCFHQKDASSRAGSVETARLFSISLTINKKKQRLGEGGSLER